GDAHDLETDLRQLVGQLALRVVAHVPHGARLEAAHPALHRADDQVATRHSVQIAHRGDVVLDVLDDFAADHEVVLAVDMFVDKIENMELATRHLTTGKLNRCGRNVGAVRLDVRELLHHLHQQRALPAPDVHHAAESTSA